MDLYHLIMPYYECICQTVVNFAITFVLQTLNYFNIIDILENNMSIIQIACLVMHNFTCKKH